jgi:hypothetical protein
VIFLDPRRLKTDLSRAYAGYHSAVRASVAPHMMGWVDLEVLDGIDELARAQANSRLAVLHRRLSELLQDRNLLVESLPLRKEFKRLYKEAEPIAFPATTAYVANTQALTDWTSNHSLVVADIARLRGLDRAAHGDPIYRVYVKAICDILPEAANAPSVQRYSQFFEIYSEALVLQFLRNNRVETWRVGEIDSQTPDFRCRLASGKEFYIEVKTLDIVGGALRHDEIMVDAIEQAVDLQEQIQAGRDVAVAEGEIAPYRRYREKETYDPRSIIRVIDTLREKFFQAFKAGQFELGPTLALAVVDRLIVPGGRNALAPYYLDRLPGPCCVSGVLWQAAFGTTGAPIFRHPDFEGLPTLEGYIEAPGIFVDDGRQFPGLALIALSRQRNTDDEALGLHPILEGKVGNWGNEDTEEALAAICRSHNDDQNTRAFELSEYAPPAPPNADLDNPAP